MNPRSVALAHNRMLRAENGLKGAHEVLSEAEGNPTPEQLDMLLEWQFRLRLALKQLDLTIANLETGL